MAKMTRAARGSSSLVIPGRPVGAFTLDGANAPTAILGDIRAVRRLVTAGGTIFFRVSLDVEGSLAAPQQGQPTAIPVAEAQFLICNIREDLTADPADTKATNEIDVTVYDAGIAAATVDTTGIQVRLGMDARV